MNESSSRAAKRARVREFHIETRREHANTHTAVGAKARANEPKTEIERQHNNSNGEVAMLGPHRNASQVYFEFEREA